uniref:Uncharacterized protein n=1 Tax=Lutzomyia longipalpis TaxID=7200 RepID=A0A7G3B2E3_LUTLO
MSSQKFSLTMSFDLTLYGSFMPNAQIRKFFPLAIYFHIIFHRAFELFCTLIFLQNYFSQFMQKGGKLREWKGKLFCPYSTKFSFERCVLFTKVVYWDIFFCVINSVTMYMRYGVIICLSHKFYFLLIS